MKIRVRYTPDNYWVVETRFLWWWKEETRMYCWSVGSKESTMKCAMTYAQNLINPEIIYIN